MESEERKQKYNEYVERITPDNKLFTDVFNAFWIGGIICLMGQIWVAYIYLLWNEQRGCRSLDYTGAYFRKCYFNRS